MPAVFIFQINLDKNYYFSTGKANKIWIYEMDEQQTHDHFQKQLKRYNCNVWEFAKK